MRWLVSRACHASVIAEDSPAPKAAVSSRKHFGSGTITIQSGGSAIACLKASGALGWHPSAATADGIRTGPTIRGNIPSIPISAKAERLELSQKTIVMPPYEANAKPPDPPSNRQLPLKAKRHVSTGPPSRPTSIPIPAACALVPETTQPARMPLPPALPKPHAPDQPACGSTRPKSRPVFPKPSS